MKTSDTSTTAFLYDGADVVSDYAVPATGTYTRSRTYVQGTGVDSKVAYIDGVETTFYNTDTLGSVNQLVDSPASGSQPVLESHVRTAWGEDIAGGTGSTRYGFTQREVDDESGLMYFRARHYSRRLGRFIQMDPVGLRSGTANLYEYVRNNPLAGGDPFGLVGPCSPVVDGKVVNGWTPPVGDGFGRALSDVGEWVKKPYSNMALGAVKGGLVGVGNVFLVFIETVDGSMHALLCPIETGKNALNEIATTIIYIDNLGFIQVACNAAEGLAAEASADPSKFSARIGVTALAGAAGGSIPAGTIRLPPALSAAIKNNRLCSAVARLANTEFKSLRFLDADLGDILSIHGNEPVFGPNTVGAAQAPRIVPGYGWIDREWLRMVNDLRMGVFTDKVKSIRIAAELRKDAFPGYTRSRYRGPLSEQPPLERTYDWHTHGGKHNKPHIQIKTEDGTWVRIELEE
jgi:RHS repeat-associated protein